MEFAMVIGLLVPVLLGTVEVGSALMARAQVSHTLSQVVRVVHLNPEATREQVEGALIHRIDSRRTAGLRVEVEEVEETRAFRIAVTFDHIFSVPLIPIRKVTMRVETMTPAIVPES